MGAMTQATARIQAFRFVYRPVAIQPLWTSTMTTAGAAQVAQRAGTAREDVA